MAQGDVKSIRSNYRGGRSGGGSSYVYDDEGRGESKSVWEWFETGFTADPTERWLLSHDDQTYYWALKASTQRFNLMDIAFKQSPGWSEYGDTRAHRLVLRKLNEESWLKFYNALIAAYERVKAQQEKERHEAAENSERQWAEYRAQREAERVELLRNELEAVQPVVELTAGMLSSELNQVIQYHEQESDHGDWIDSAADAYMGHGGWGEETGHATGIKLSITLSLDLSNSMYYNSIHAHAAGAFRDIGMALRALKAEYKEDLTVGFFTFSEGSKGNYATQLRDYSMSAGNTPKLEDGRTFGELNDFRPSVVKSWYSYGPFAGEDTHITPLLKAIEKWEKDEVDPGAIRLDLVITDAVLEHKYDIKEADVIQERRNGALQTIMLNFMPEKSWLGSTLPKRCFMLKVDKDNINGILRNTISEFVGAHL